MTSLVLRNRLLHFLQKAKGPYRKTSMGNILCSRPVPFILHTLLDTLNLGGVVKWLVTRNSWKVLRHKLSIITQHTLCCSVLVPTGYTVPIVRKDARDIRKHCPTSGLNAGWALQGLCGEDTCCGMWRCVTVCGCRAVCTHLMCSVARESVSG